MEFLMGDEAIKALPLAKRLSVAAKTAQSLEGSPRIMRALQVGAGVLKRAGLSAAEAGTVQGAQTFVRSGGDVGKTAEDTALAAGTAGVLGTATGTVARVLGKGADAAQTIGEMGQRAAGAPTREAVSQGLNDAVDTGTSYARETAQGQFDQAGNQIQEMGRNAPGNEEITSQAKGMVNDAHKKLSTEYRQGLGQLQGLVGDTTIPYEDSPLHKAAQEIAEQGKADAGPLDRALSKSRPGSPRVNDMIDKLANFGEDGEEEQSQGAHGLLGEFINNGTAAGAGAAEEADQAPQELSLGKLAEYRQVLGERLRNLGWSSSDDNADRKIYSKLIEGVDNTIGKLADNADAQRIADGGEEGEEGEAGQTARSILDEMNGKYKEGIRRFQNKDVQALWKGNNNDVSNRLIKGETSLDDIDAVRKTVGDANFQKLGQDSFKRLVADSMGDAGTGDEGKLNYKQFLSKWNRIDPRVRTAMFGSANQSALTDALNQATNATGKLADINKTVTDLIGNGDVDSLMKDPQRVSDLSKQLGTNGMKELGKSIMDNRIAEASSTLDPKTGEFAKTRFDPDKVLDWWNGMKDSPEVRNSLFTVDSDSAAHYNDLMKRLAQASSVKKLVKYGVLPVTLGTAGVIHGPGAALVAAVAGLGTEASFGRARDILDSMANNPRTWKSLEWAGKASKALDTSAPAQTVKKSAYNVMKTLSTSLGGNSNQQQ
jgi:hypothetical protein